MKPAHYFRPLLEADLQPVMAIEQAAYEFPWSLGNFRDCLRAGYYCPAICLEDDIHGYGIMSEAVGEAHILNLCIDPRHQGAGLGRLLLNQLLDEANRRRVSTVFLEVRASNRPAIGLYESTGFNEVGLRPGYYPARQGREDAIVYALALSL